MKHRFIVSLLCICATLSINCNEKEKTSNLQSEEGSINKMQIIYLAQSKNYKKALSLYMQLYQLTNRHDFEILEGISRAILEHGARSSDAQLQLLSIYANSLAGLSCSFDILEAGILSPNMQTQLASIQLLAKVQDDHIDYLLNKAMSSDFLYSRLEAAYIMCARKSRNAVGQVEALMHKLPPQMSYFFPELFALVGTSEAVGILRHMIDDRFQPTRIEAILSAARHGRDDLLPEIRSCATHVNIAEQEACATALGFLRDSHSINRLKKLSKSSSENVKLAALRSLYFFGHDLAKEEIFKMAQEGNLFAITMLSDIPDSDGILLKLLSDDDMSIRLNASLSLLKRKNPLVVPFLKEFLLKDSRDIGFVPQGSVGGSLRALKVISSAQQHAKHSYYDLLALGISVRESILKECIELPEESFLKVAQLIFDLKQNELVPLTVALLENMKTTKAIDLLKSKSQTAGAPLIRSYCNLALVRLKEVGPYEQHLKNWIESNKSKELIQFRPSLAWGTKLADTNFELTPEESSSLLIQSYQVLADRHDEKSIEFILQSMQNGENKNIPILAGILLKAIQ